LSCTLRFPAHFERFPARAFYWVLFSRVFFVDAWFLSRACQGGDQFRLPVHSTPEEYENGDFSLKMHSIFSVHTTLEEFKNAAITTHLGFVLEQNHMIVALSSFSKSFAQMFFFNTKTERRRFQILLV